ncbi:MAG: ATP-grasp domain-containing protein [Patescibacteria group bacterium]
MKQKTSVPILGELFKKLAPKIGAKIIIEPNWKIVGQIIFKNGKKRYFRYTSLDINTLGASEIAKDKGYANFFMKKMGYPTIPGETYYSKKWCKTIKSNRDIKAAYSYAEKIGWPLIVKPNSGSQGTNVSMVNNKKEFYQAMKKIFISDNIALVQKFVKGQDYRIVVLDNKIISAYQRIPFSITGDGILTVKKLITKKLNDFIILDRPSKLKINDPRLAQNLKLQDLGFNSIIEKNKKIYLLNNANLSTGGESVDVTKVIHPDFKKIAINLTKDMGLRLCGVDLMIKGNIKNPAKKYWVIEVNAAPGLDHYIKTGAEQEKIVEAMYLEILKSMQK